MNGYLTPLQLQIGDKFAECPWPENYRVTKVGVTRMNVTGILAVNLKTNEEIFFCGEGAFGPSLYLIED